MGSVLIALQLILVLYEEIVSEGINVIILLNAQSLFLSLLYPQIDVEPINCHIVRVSKYKLYKKHRSGCD